jgi:hypothetical protein
LTASTTGDTSHRTTRYASQFRHRLIAFEPYPQVVKNGGTAGSWCSASALQTVTNGTPVSCATVAPSGVTWSTSSASMPSSRAILGTSRRQSTVRRRITSAVYRSALIPPNPASTASSRATSAGGYSACANARNAKPAPSTFARPFSRP